LGRRDLAIHVDRSIANPIGPLRAVPIWDRSEPKSTRSPVQGAEWDRPRGSRIAWTIDGIPGGPAAGRSRSHDNPRLAAGAKTV